MVAILATGFNCTISHQFEALADITFPQQLMNHSRRAADPRAAEFSRNPRPSPSILRSCPHGWLFWLSGRPCTDLMTTPLPSCFLHTQSLEVAQGAHLEAQAMSEPTVWFGGRKKEPNV